MKFAKEDREFFDRRKVFGLNSLPTDLWSVVDHWPLYVGTVNFARNLAIVDLLRSTISIPGHVAEFGCWRGSTSLLLAKALRIFDPSGPKVVHVFDSFQGLTEFRGEDGVASERSGGYRGSRAIIEECAMLVGLEDHITIHEGLIERTLPQFVERRPELRFSFVYCDTDLYSATKDILAEMWDLMTPGGLMVFDQWNMEEFPGEGIAVNEFLREAAGSLEAIKPAFTRQPTLAVRRLR
jgi:SAM-dependent methyltransferase